MTKAVYVKTNRTLLTKSIFSLFSLINIKTDTDLKKNRVKPLVPTNTFSKIEIFTVVIINRLLYIYHYLYNLKMENVGET